MTTTAITLIFVTFGTLASIAFLTLLLNEIVELWKDLRDGGE